MNRFAVVTITLLFSCLVAFSSGCAKPTNLISGTKIPSTDENRQLIKVVERYRQAIERKDTGALLLMASQRSYYEDGGTQDGSDDYDYAGLRDVLAGRFLKASNIRYSIRYVRIRRRGPRAFVEIFVDASFSMTDSTGQERREQIRDQNLLVLIQEKNKWKFVSGM